MYAPDNSLAHRCHKDVVDPSCFFQRNDLVLDPLLKQHLNSCAVTYYREYSTTAEWHSNKYQQVSELFDVIVQLFKTRPETEPYTAHEKEALSTYCIWRPLFSCIQTYISTTVWNLKHTVFDFKTQYLPMLIARSVIQTLIDLLNQSKRKNSYSILLKNGDRNKIWRLSRLYEWDNILSEDRSVYSTATRTRNKVFTLSFDQRREINQLQLPKEHWWGHFDEANLPPVGYSGSIQQAGDCRAEHVLPGFCVVEEF